MEKSLINRPYIEKTNFSVSYVKYNPARAVTLNLPSLIQQLLRSEQIEKNALALEVQELKKQLVDAQNKEPKTERPRRKRQLPKIVDEDLNSQVKTLGQKFTYMSLLWLHQPLETFQLPLDEEYDPLDRFESEEGWLQGQLRDLLEAIPAKFHEDMDDERFVNTFTHGMHTQRSNASTRVRRQTGAAIFGCTDEEFTNRGGTFKKMIGWRWTPADNNAEPGSYVAFTPILFKDYTGRFDKWKVFRNPILMRTYAALVLGPSSVKDAKGDEIFVRKESHYNIESLWGIRSITPAAIAASAVLARFSASNDQAFQPIGAVTKIDYQSDFEFYFKYLSEGVRAKKPSVVKIIENWNEVFYSNFPTLSMSISQSRAKEDLGAIMDNLYNEEEETAERSEGNEEVRNQEPQMQSNTGQRSLSPLTNPDDSPLRPSRSNQEPRTSNPPGETHIPVKDKSRKRKVVEDSGREEQENVPPKKRRTSGRQTGKNGAKETQTTRRVTRSSKQ
ncbi:hypothetical protein M422DRAFT_266679 [Sphaerobolus stellatus SS14]|uniref:Uncharacterized protein n=1 Tax=Sphaerobolus stellatus (strain SS14) TaxID=990650 RepID=A0A0C9UAT3_SPHS4|nr:hypothetical protein M422DRAFT_266679 [Sphaerobolus stellatus SS14]